MSTYLDIDEETRRLLLDQRNDMEVHLFPHTNSTKERPWAWHQLEDDKDFKCNKWWLTKQ